MTTREEIRDALLRNAVRAAKVGLWDWDLRNGTVVFSDEWKSLLGYASDEIQDGFAEWEARIHADDLPRIKQLLADYLADPWPDYRAEFRMRHKDGGWRWLLTQADVTRDEQGRALHMIGSHIDITDQKRAELELARTSESLRATERQLRGLLDQFPDLVSRFDREGRHLYANPAVLSVFGATLESCLGRTPVEMGVATDVRGCTALLDGIKQTVAECRPNIVEVDFQTSDGPRTFEVRHIPELDEQGQVLSVVGIARDITERRRAEESVRNAERQLSTLIDNFPDFVSRFDARGRFVYISPSVTRTTGATLDAVIGRTPHELGICFDKEHDIALQASLARVVAEGESEELDVAFGTQAGPRTYRVRHIPERDDRGVVVSVLGVATDRSEREAAERQLYLLNYALDEVGEAIFLMEGESPLFKYVNRSAADSLGYDRATLTGGMGVPDIDPETNLERWKSLMPVIRERRRLTLESIHRARDGRLIPVEVTGNFFTFEGRDYNMALVRDISERRNAERALRESETMYRSLVTAMAEGAVFQAASGEITAVNPAAERIEGRTAEEMLGTTSDAPEQDAIREDGSPFPPEERPAMVTLRTGESQSNVVMGILRPDRTRRWIAINSQPLITPGEPLPYAAVTTFHDITERREAEAALRGSQALLQAVVDNSTASIYVKDLEGRFLLVNRHLAESVQMDRSALLGKTDADLFPPERASAVRAVDKQVIAHGTALESEEVVPLEDGEHTYISIKAPLTDPNGRIFGLCGISTDITARKRAEADLRHSEEQLRQAQKMEAIGNLAGGIAHDFNNLLSIIMSYSSMLAGQVKPSDPMLTDLQEIEAAGERAAELTRQLLAFGRKQILQPKIVNLNDILVGVERMLRRLIGEDIELLVVADSTLGRTMVDPGQIEQIIMNLTVNSRDAMPRGGRLTIETANVELDEHYAATHPGVVAGPHVMLAVTDNGMGMDKATRARMFEPFFTTKGKGKGTGLGLATVFGIVRQSGGSIWTYSEPGKGTSFKIYLPRTDAVAQEPTGASPPTLGRLFGTETILLVEDEERVRKLVRTILERHGYQVLEAQSGGDALLICEDHPETIHLLLTDVIMPRMSGPQLSERLHPLRPDMQVLFMSGYTDNSVVHHGVLDAGVAFLQKPITPDALTRKVREILDGVRPGP